MPDSEDLEPLFETIRRSVPPPSYDPDHPLQALVTNLDASPYMGRLALCRVRHGTLRRGQDVAWCRSNGSIDRVKVTELYPAKHRARLNAHAFADFALRCDHHARHQPAVVANPGIAPDEHLRLKVDAFTNNRAGFHDA